MTRPMRALRLPTGSLALMLLVACESTTATCDCPPLRYQAVIYGRVTNAAGAPVQSARIVAELGAPGCAQALETVGEVLTSLDGTYRTLLVASSRQPRPGDCLRAFAAAPAGSTLRGSDTVSFALGFGVDEVVDSARVNLVLRAP